ncbi:PPIC-type PPIASE domain protein [SAR86 cluster bacterium SAR86E]|uniref:Periplasmic chaperone PpiD n=1 Tax=SAR86 cluster bacterium SAR86E TaxID=1208365 RepID=K6G7N1_9GAMM|nr:PPIC-type PPIASE domain protein [SAR86 cluster bacterium SAR86E]
MLELLRNFLSGKRVIVIAILLAIPFIFFGSTSFGTTFSSFGSVNGEPVTQKDINLASSQVNQRLQSVYGEEFNLDDLEESVSIELIKNEIINQKTLLSKAKDLGLSVSIKEAKKEIINLEMFQGEQGFDQNLFESTIRSNGWTPDEYFALVQDSIALDRLLGAMSAVAFPIRSDLTKLASLLETSRDIDFVKVDKQVVVGAQDATLEEAEAFYNANPFLFLSEEKRDFSYLVLSYDAYKEQVEIPDNFIEDAYADYLNNIDQQKQNRISHYMIDKFNYDDVNEARAKIESAQKALQANQITFEALVAESSEDLASKDSMGDLGLSSGDAFPDEFEETLTSMQVDETSAIIELEDSFHILKLTEVLQPEVKSKASVEKELLAELVDAEALALLQDDFLELETLVLEGVTLNELANTIDRPIEVTGLNSVNETTLNNFATLNIANLFNPSVVANQIEIFEGEDSYAFVAMTQAIEPAVQDFVEVAEQAISEVRNEKANEILANFSGEAEKVVLGELSIPSQDGFSFENYKSVQRFSSLLPSEVINSVFELAVGSLVSAEASNGDLYWIKSSNEVTPGVEELGDAIDRYEGFYNESLGSQFSGFLDHTISQGQRVRLENFASAE